MEFSWSALWNITDETPDNCEMFLNYSGMKLFLECLKVSTSGSFQRNADISSRDAGVWAGSLAMLVYKQYFLYCTNRKEKACVFASSHIYPPNHKKNRETYTHLPLSSSCVQSPLSRAALNLSFHMYL